jgi:hypothetical protein
MTSDAPFTPADIEEVLIEARRRRPGTMKQIALLLEANALVGLAHMQWTTPPAAVATSHPAALQPPITQVMWCGLREQHEHHRHANRPDVQCPGATSLAGPNPADTSWITTGSNRYVAPAQQPIAAYQLDDRLIAAITDTSTDGGFTPSPALARRQLLAVLDVLRTAAERENHDAAVFIEAVQDTTANR